MRFLHPWVPRRSRARSVRRSVRLLLPFLAAVVAVLVAAPGATAATALLEVEVESPGRVVGTNIDCPDDCRDTVSWRDEQTPPTRELVARPVAGWERVTWSGCTPVPGSPLRCTVRLDSSGSVVRATFADTQAPTLELEQPADGLLVRPETSFTVAPVVDDNVGVTRLEYYDGTTLFDTRTTAPWSVPRAMGVRADGKYVLKVGAYDAAGNSSTAWRSVVVDGTPPVVDVEGPAVRTTRAAYVDIGWSYSEPHSPHSQCELRAPGASTWTLITCGLPSTRVALPNDGRWEVRFRVDDALGYVTDRTVEIVVDRTGPIGRISRPTADGAVIGTADAGVTLEAEDDTGPVSWTCTVDDQATPCDSGDNVLRLPDGPVRLVASPTDALGNRGADVERRFVVDTVAPTITLTAGPTDGAEVTGPAEVAFAWAVDDQTAASQECRWDDGAWEPCTGRASRTLVAGEHVFVVRATDAAGHATTATRRLRVLPAPGGGDPGTPGGPQPGGGDPGTPGGPQPGGGDPGTPGGPQPGGATPDGGSKSTVTSRCVVPKVRRGSTAAAARKRLRAAGCRPKTRKVRSASVRRGRVVRLSQRAGRRLPARATVVVSVSRGRS